MHWKDEKKVMIIAGEASGDLHAGNLVKAVKEKTTSVSFAGVGGDRLRDQGVDILYDIKYLSVSGVTEVFSVLPSVFKALGVVKSRLKENRPDLLILIDFAEFNLKVAAYAREYRIPVLYYIPPKVWASRAGRINKIRERVDHVAVILPFEADFFNMQNVPATYVGNPLLDDYPEPFNWQYNAGAPVVGLLPGSRKSEIAYHTPILVDAARRIKSEIPDVTFLMSLAPSADRDRVQQQIDSCGEPLPVELVSGSVRSIFERATFLVAASGTVTLEAALAGIPMVIVYKVSALTYAIARRLAKVDYMGLANLIADREIIPELQSDRTDPATITEMTVSMLKNPDRLVRMRQDMIDIRKQLGGPGASSRMADFTLAILYKD